MYAVAFACSIVNLNIQTYYKFSSSLYLSDSADVIVLCEQNNLQAVLQTCTADAILPRSMLDA